MSTGKPRSDEPTVAVLVINGPFSFCIAHLFLSSAGTEVPIDRVQDSSIVHDDVVGYLVPRDWRLRSAAKELTL